MTELLTGIAGDILVALTFDLDPDSFDTSIGAHRAAQMTWRGIEEGVPAILDVLDNVGERPRATWFVRADDHVAEVCGDAGALLDAHDALLRSLANSADEVGWHPNLYRRSGEGWAVETDDDAAADQMHRGAEAFRARGWPLQCSRMGENLGSNRIMQTLEDLDIALDSTAMPGRRRNDEERCFDWLETPREPYFPDRDDYRRPGEPSFAVLEVPMTMVPVKADYDEAPLDRYIDLAFHPRALRQGLSGRLANAKMIMTVTHPSCVLPGIASKPHGLLSFDIGAFEQNLRQIVDDCDRLGRRIRFVTLSEAARSFAPAGQENER